MVSTVLSHDVASSYAEDRRLTKDGGEVRIQLMRTNILRLLEWLYSWRGLFSRQLSQERLVVGFSVVTFGRLQRMPLLLCGSRPRFGSLVPNRKQRGSDRAVSRS